VTVTPLGATEPTPTMSRRHAAGSESARGLLFTVLGEFVLPGGGSAWTSAIIDVLGRLDIEEKTARQALMRTAADGWMTSERVGRRTRWHLTPSAEQLLVDGTRRIYGFTGPARDWDGRWLVVLARVPETDRSARHYLRTRLTWAGLGSPTPGVWVGTHTDRLGAVEEVLRQAGVFDDAQVFVAEHQGRTAIQAMVDQAWDLGEIDEEYKGFVAEFKGRTKVVDPLARTAELVHAWRRFPWLDPALPTELLPARWSGLQAVELFARQHAALAPAAREVWDRIAAAG
jgi:phenylacetic acid degradation operon negative regulatory protein